MSSNYSSWNPNEEEDEEEDSLLTDDQETQWASKDAIVFVIDCSESMLEPTEETGDTPVLTAVKCASELLKHKIVASNSDLVGMVFYNTDKTKNTLSSAENIYILHDLDVPDAQRIKELDLIHRENDPESFRQEYGSTNNGAALSDVFFACNLLFSACAQKVGSKRIFLITNEDNPDGSNPTRQVAAQTRAADIADLGIRIELFNLDKNGESFDFDRFYTNIIVRGDDDEDPATVDGSTKLEALAVKIRRKEIKKRSQFRIPFTLAEGIVIGVRGYAMILEQKKPSPKHIYLEGDTAREVIATTSWICNDTTQMLLPSDMKYFYPYGGEQVVFTKEELTEMKNFAPPGITLMGFKPIHALKLHHNLKHPYFIYPDESEYAGSITAFSALLKVLSQDEKVAICRFVPRKNTAPRFAALVPQLEIRDSIGQVRPPGFNVIPLPFCEDIRQIPYEGVESGTKVENVDQAKKIIDRIMVKGGYQPDNYENPVLQKHYTNLQAIALDQETKDENQIKDQTLPKTEAIQKRAGPLIQEFKNGVYGEEFVPPVDGKLAKGKRTSDSVATPARAPKTARITEPGELMDVESYYTEGKIKKLTVPQLKAWLLGKEIKPKTKKDDLIAQVEELLR